MDNTQHSESHIVVHRRVIFFQGRYYFLANLTNCVVILGSSDHIRKYETVTSLSSLVVI